MSLKDILGEELFNQVTAKLGDKKIDVVNDGNWIPKDKFDALNETNKTYKGQVEKLNTDLETLKKSAGDNETLKQHIENLKKDNEGLQGKVKDISLDSAIKVELVKANAKYSDLLIGKFDKTKLEVSEDGTIKGLDDQIKSLKEGYKELFGETVPPNPGANPPGGGNPTKNPWSKETFNLTEQGKILRENPDLAAQYKAAVGVK